MASSQHDNVSMALFCDFENVALGVRDAKYEKFDIKLVLERLLLKGSIVVKKAYCDWERYKGFKATMHEASFELIEIPHVRQSGKNSADIRLVVDALDLCYTKSHVNTFVIISGDSDFSPLVSKLRENAKHVIGVGVKQSTSDLLIANCDEFIFYDDLVRESESERAATRPERETQPAKRSPDEEKRGREEQERRKTQAVELAVETFDALVAERGDSGKIWASLLKEAIKRRKPGFNESYYGFRAFGNLLEEAQSRGLLELGRDEKSGTYVHRATGAAVEPEMAIETAPPASREATAEHPAEEAAPRPETRRRGRGRTPAEREHPVPGHAETPASRELAPETSPPAEGTPFAEAAVHAEHEAPALVEATRSPPAAPAAAEDVAPTGAVPAPSDETAGNRTENGPPADMTPAPAAEPAAGDIDVPAPAAEKPARKTSARSGTRTARKPAAKTAAKDAPGVPPVAPAATAEAADEPPAAPAGGEEAESAARKPASRRRTRKPAPATDEG